jgi:hypothetical protein
MDIKVEIHLRPYVKYDRHLTDFLRISSLFYSVCIELVS